MQLGDFVYRVASLVLPQYTESKNENMKNRKLNALVERS